MRLCVCLCFLPDPKTNSNSSPNANPTYPQVVMVTGANGGLAKELCTQLVRACELRVLIVHCRRHDAAVAILTLTLTRTQTQTLTQTQTQA